MSNMKLSVILLALLLAAMAMVPIVSAGDVSSERIAIIQNNYITEKEAYGSAQNELTQFVSDGLLGEEFSGASVSPDPVSVYDINGLKLYYSFPVLNGKKRIGEVKIAASKVFGAPLISIGNGPQAIAMDELNRKAEQALKNAGYSPDKTSTRLVCYAYPKVGLGVTVPAKSGAETTLIIDAYDYSVIPSSGQGSMYESFSLDSMKSGVISWDAQEQKATRQSLTVSPRATVSKTLSGFTLYAQEGTNWCAFATAKMISAWYGVSKSQSQIAQTAGVNPDNGATETEITNGYYIKSTAQGGLGKSGSFIRIGSPSNLYDLIKTEIDASRPVVINIGIQPGQSTNYHARACAGYSRDTSSGNIYFYLYDPWPVNSGALSWERWYGISSPYVSSIFVRN